MRYVYRDATASAGPSVGTRVARVGIAASPPCAERRAREMRDSLGVAPSLRVLSLADAVRLQLVVDEVVLSFALLSAVLAREPLVSVGLRVHIEHMLAQVGGGGVHAAAQRALRSVAQGRPARQSRPCNTEAAVRHRIRTVLSAIVSVSIAVFCGRGGVAPPLLDAVYGVHVYLHVLARLEGLAAHGAGVRQLARRVHVEDVLLEVAIVAVALAARGAGGPGGRLTVRVGAVGREVLALGALPRPAASCRRRVSFSATHYCVPSRGRLLRHFPVRLLRAIPTYFGGEYVLIENGIME